MLEDATYREPPKGMLPEVYNATPGGDHLLAVEFFRHPAEDKDCIRIQFRGDPTTIIEEPVEDRHRNQWPDHWEAYAAGLEMAQNGTPLYEVKWVDQGMIGRLNGLRVFTVEQLASLNDGAIEQSGIMGLGMFRERARKHMERMSRAVGMDQAYAANQELANTVRQLQQQLAELTAQAGGQAPEEPEGAQGGAKAPSGGGNRQRRR